MKTRSGFVSNSSTSSFIIVGFKRSEISLIEDDLRSIINKHDLEEEAGWGDPLIGILFDGMEHDIAEFRSTQLVKAINTMTNLFGKAPSIYLYDRYS